MGFSLKRPEHPAEKLPDIDIRGTGGTFPFSRRRGVPLVHPITLPDLQLEISGSRGIKPTQKLRAHVDAQALGTTKLALSEQGAS